MWWFVVILLKNQNPCSLIFGTELRQIGHTAMCDVGSTKLWVEYALADIKCHRFFVWYHHLDPRVRVTKCQLIILVEP